MHHAEQPVAEPVGDPYVALAVDGEAAAVVADLEILGLARIGGGKSRDVVDAAVAHPNPVLLVDGEMERGAKRLARLRVIALADDPALGQIALRKVDELAFLDAENPDVAARRHDHALHQSEPAAEGDAFGRRQGLAGLVEDGDRLAAVVGEPRVVIGVDRGAEGAALHAAAGKTRGDRRERAAIWRELGRVALPQRVRRLPADGEIVADPEVALTVERRLAAGAIAAAIELERQHPGARRGVEIGHERNRAQVFARRDRIEKVEQPEEPVWQIPGSSARRPRPPSAYRPARRPSAAWPPGTACHRQWG